MPLAEISLEDYAVLERGNSERVVSSNGVHWRAIRPGFYQPLALFAEYPPGSTRGPASSWFGGWQHAVPPGMKSNSSLKLIGFQDVKSYSIDTIVPARKRQKMRSVIKGAQKRYEVREIATAAQFAEEAHPVYLDFQQRTGYVCMTDRLTPEGFAAWAERLFSPGKICAMGAYSESRLHAVTVWYLIQGTLVFASMFSSSESQRHGVSDLLLHHARLTAAEHPDVHSIFATRFRSGEGLDQFYLHRGAVVISKPAWLQINWAADQLLRVFKPEARQALWGAEPAAVVEEGASPEAGSRLGSQDEAA